VSGRRVTLEVCLDSLASAIAARTGGADRIELCAAMDDGGLTPSYGLIRAVRRAVRVPLHVLVRPRTGDFHYSTGELRTMADDVEAARDLGADGVVLGALTAARSVDSRAMRRLVAAARPMSVTFHRAFDDVPGRGAALDALIDLGVDRVLTSGGKPTAFEGRRAIARTVADSAGRIGVIAGGGVDPRSVVRLLEATGADEVHTGSAVATARTSGRGGYRARIGVVDAAKVRRFVRSLRELG